MLQLFIGMMAVMGLALAAAVGEHKRAQEALQRGHDEQERRVRERTAELGEANVAPRRQDEERRQAEGRLRQSERQVPGAEKLGQPGAWARDVGPQPVRCSPPPYPTPRVTPD